MASLTIAAALLLLLPAAGRFLVVADPLPPSADAIVVLAGPRAPARRGRGAVSERSRAARGRDARAAAVGEIAPAAPASRCPRAML